MPQEQDSTEPVLPQSSNAEPFTVEVHHQYNPVQQHWSSQVFIKLYTAALSTGFLAAISDRDWRTLCAIALHMDDQGRCYPSRDAIARALGVNPSTASERIQHLLRFRWQDRPIVRAVRERQPDGTLGRQVYTILPLGPFGFGPASPVDNPATRSAFPNVAGNQVGISQLGDSQLGKPRPLQTRSRLNKIRSPKKGLTKTSTPTTLAPLPPHRGGGFVVVARPGRSCATRRVRSAARVSA